MSESKIGAEVVLEAMVTRADGTVENLGVISANRDDLPEWFKELKNLETYKTAEKFGVIE